MKLAHRVLRRSGSADGVAAPKGGTGGTKRDAWLRRLGLVPWALALGLEKRAKLRQAIRARNRGMIVVCDRFPQAQVMGFNDGPLLNHWAGRPGALRKALARWEAQPYTHACFDPPDLVIKLKVTPEVAVERKPEMTLPEVRRRSEAVQSLRFPPQTVVLSVDTDAPLDEVLARAKQAVWRAL
jgi:thymidylate kinase